MTSYPIDMPNDRIAGLALSVQHSARVSTSSFTYQQQVSDLGGDRWTLDFEPPRLSRAQAEDWLAFALSLRGAYGTFLAGDPWSAHPRGVATGTPLVSGGGQTGYTLAIDGCTPNVTGWMKKGDYIQYGSGSTARLNKLLADADTDGSGETTLELALQLRYSPTDNSAIVVRNPKGVFRLNNNATRWSVDQTNVWRFSFSAVEVIG